MGCEQKGNGGLIRLFGFMVFLVFFFLENMRCWFVSTDDFALLWNLLFAASLTLRELPKDSAGRLTGST